MRSGRYLSMLLTVVLAALTASHTRPAGAAAAPVPQTIEALPGDGAVLILFSQVPNAAGYNAYRRQAGQKPEKAASAGPDPAHTVSFTIDLGPGGRGLADGTPLFYSVTAVVNGVEGPASAEVVVTPQKPIAGFFDYSDIGTLSPGQATLDGKILTLRGSGDGIGDAAEGQTFLSTLPAGHPVTGDFTLTAELLRAPQVVSGADPASTDEGIVGLEAREDGPFPYPALLPGARYALVGVFVHHDPGIVFEGQKGAPGGASKPFSSPGTSLANAQSPLFLRLQKAGTILRAFQSADGTHWQMIGDDQDFGPIMPNWAVGFVAAAHKEGAYVSGQFDFSTVSLTTP